MASSILQIVILQIIVNRSLCNGQQCTGTSCPDGFSLVPIKNFSDSERWTFDSNDTVQVVCYNETGEPQGCHGNNADIYTILLKVACSLSIVGDGVVILSLCMFRTIRTSFHVLLINVCLANCGFDLTVVVLGSTKYTRELCYSIAVLVHFSLLSQFMLMSVTMFDIVRSFYNANKLKKQSLNYQYGWVLVLLVFGWGVPLLIVTAALIVDNTSEWVGYGRNPYTCEIDHHVSVIILFVVPLSISIFFNMIMFTIIVAVLTHAFCRNRKHTNKKKKFLYTRFIITILCASGITWIFVIFGFASANVWVERAAVVLSSCQGLVLCVAFLFRWKVFQRFPKLISDCRADLTIKQNTIT